MKSLNSAQTRRAIAEIGIERSLLETFGFSDAALKRRYAFHRHKKHQLLSPLAGIVMVETGEALHVVSPTQAAWIPAGVRHATTIGDAPACSLFFPISSYTSPSSDLQVLRTSPLLRELLLSGSTSLSRFPRRITQSLFDLLHYLCCQALTNREALLLPRPRSARLLKAFDWLLDHLEEATVPLLARHSGLSERSLRRHYRQEMGLTPERYLQQVRLTKAMQLLIEHPRERNVTEIALAVGYQNPSAFSAAFRQFTGQSPSEFRAVSSSP